MSALDKAILRVQNRWTINRVLLWAILVLFCAAACFVAKTFFAPWLSILVGSISALISFVLVVRHGLHKKIFSRSDAASYLDDSLGTKERILTIRSNEASIECPEKITFIRSQIDENLLLQVLPPWNIPKIFRAIFFLSIFCLLTTYGFRWYQERSLKGEIIALIEEVTSQENLPEPVKDAMESLADTIATEKLSGEEVKAALEEAKNSVDSALSSLGDNSKNQGTKPKGSELVVPTPTPTATPAGSKESSTKEADQQHTKSQDSQSKNAEDSKQGDKGGKGEGDEGKQGGDSDKNDSDSGAQGSDKSESKGTAGESAKKDSDSKSGSPQSGKSGGEKSKEDNGKSDSNNQSNGADQGKDSKGDQKSDNKKPGASGASAAKDTLQKIEQKMQQASGASQKGSDSPSENNSQNGQDSQSSQSGEKGEPRSAQENQGASEGGKGEKKDSESNESKDQGEKSGEKRDQNRQAEEGNKRSDPSGKNDSTSPAQDSSLGQMKNRVEVPGQEGDQGEHKRSIKETMLGENDEKFDTSFTGKEKENALNKEEARPKTSLSDITTSKPVGVSEEVQQQIPQEYKDSIR